MDHSAAQFLPFCETVKSNLSEPTISSGKHRYFDAERENKVNCPRRDKLLINRGLKASNPSNTRLDAICFDPTLTI